MIHPIEGTKAIQGGGLVNEVAIRVEAEIVRSAYYEDMRDRYLRLEVEVTRQVSFQ